MLAHTAALALLLSAQGLPLAEGPAPQDAGTTPQPQAVPVMTIQAILEYADSAPVVPENNPAAESNTYYLPDGDPPEMKLRVIPIGPENDQQYILMQTLKASPDSGSITYRQRYGEELNLDCIALNGKKVITIPQSTDPSFSPDSKSVAFILRERGWKLYYQQEQLNAYEPVSPVRFSPDGKRKFYLAREEDKQFVVDGQYAHPQADSLDWDSLVVSPDSSVIAYPAYINDAWRVVVNGDPGPAWDRIASPLITTRTGPGVFYTVFHQGQYHLVDRHTAGPGMYLIDSAPITSDDGSTFAYWAMGRDQVWRVYRNHKPVRGYEAGKPGQLALSADGQSLAAVLKRDNRWLLVQDKQPGPAYTAIGQGSLTISADGKRLAYAVRNQTGWAVIVDGKEQATYAQLAAGSLRFSPDSRRFVYVALTEGRWSLIEGEQSQPAFSQIDTKTLTFSPDSQRIAYLVSNLGRPAVVLDGQMLGEYDDVRFPTFSPNSKHLVYVATLAGKSRLFADGFPTSETFDELIPGAAIHFRGNDVCQTVALRLPDPDDKIINAVGKKRINTLGSTFWRFELDLTPIKPKNPASTPEPAEPDSPQDTAPDLPDPSFVDVPTEQ